MVAWSETAWIGATNRSCPKCKVGPREPCVTTRGPIHRRHPMKRYHTERYEAGLHKPGKESTAP